MGTVVATLTTANLQNLTDQYQADLASLPPSNGNPPPSATVLPNGRPSTVWTSYRETETYSPEGTTGISTNWPEFNLNFPRATPTGALIREGTAACDGRMRPHALPMMAPTTFFGSLRGPPDVSNGSESSG